MSCHTTIRPRCSDADGRPCSFPALPSHRLRAERADIRGEIGQFLRERPSTIGFINVAVVP
jgi:hypothetical protein